MRFKVNSVPDGEAPLEIREEWVGVVLPVKEMVGVCEGYGVLTNRREVTMEDAIAISVDDAVQALNDAGKGDAARWWRANYSGSELLFEKSWGELLSDAD